VLATINHIIKAAPVTARKTNASPGDKPFPMRGPTDWNYGDILDAVAEVVPPERPALIWRDAVVTWPEFTARTNNLARAFAGMGLAADDRAAILCHNHPAYMETMAACLKARVLQVNINYRYVADEISYVVDNCAASMFIYQDVFDALVAELKPMLTSVRHWVRIETGRVREPVPDGDLSFEAMATSGDGAPLGIERSGNDGYLLYTGGTTGKPKGVLWAAAQARRSQLESPLLARVPQSLAEHQEIVRANPAPSVAVPACPLMHGSGSNAVMVDLLNGGSVVILPSPRFDADELWAEVGKHGVTRIAIVGDVFAKPMLAALDRAPDRYDVSTMRIVTSAGLTWSADVKAGLLRHMPQALAVDVLGASEGSGLGYSIARAGSIPETGVFEAGRDTVLIDPDTGAILPRDREVEGLLGRSGAMATGYYRDPAATAKTYMMIDGERHVVPGDVARWIPPNRFMLLGRGNMSINSGGEKIFPEEVEEALKHQPGVADALVVGVPDDRWGKMIVAIVEATDGFDEARIRTGLGATLSSYKHPKRFVIADAVPRHESGKPDYRRAAALAAA
jgi:3-oxocholest-4-en-26-oate---CoA ligase